MTRVPDEKRDRGAVMKMTLAIHEPRRFAIERAGQIKFSAPVRKAAGQTDRRPTLVSLLVRGLEYIGMILQENAAKQHTLYAPGRKTAEQQMVYWRIHGWPF